MTITQQYLVSVRFKNQLFYSSYGKSDLTMPWSRDYVINEGIHGEANGVQFDIIVRNTRGSYRERSASLEVRFGDSNYRIRVHSNRPPKKIFEGLDMQLSFNEELQHTRKVRLVCHGNYVFNVKTYPVK